MTDGGIKISAQRVMEPRQRTGFGIMRCKAELLQYNDDMVAAFWALLRPGGLNPAEHASPVGRIGVYVAPHG